MESIQETEARYGEKATTVLNGWYEVQNTIAREVTSVEGPHADVLTAEQAAGIIRKQKAARAAEKSEEYRQQYQNLTEERNEAVRARTRSLREQLFRVQDAAALSRAALASDAELGSMLELATVAGNEDLARAVFVAADQRGLGDLMHAYFGQVNLKAGELYQEFKGAPSEESLERRLADAETLFDAPDAAYFASALGSA